MKQSKAINIALAVVNVILIVSCVVMYLRTDRTAPEFDFQADDMVYRRDMNAAELITGITAHDRIDGDVTERIVIEKIIENQKDSTVVVFYAVSDKFGNVAKTSRLFRAVFDEEAENFMEAGISAELNQDSNWLDSESSREEMDGQTGTPQTTPTLQPAPSEAPTPLPTSTPAPTATPQPTSEPAPQPPAAPAQDPGAPTLTLKVSEVKVNAGQGPAWVDVIGTLSDDEDDYNTLFHNLNVSRYDRNKPGTYQVSVHTEDSDGNKSQSVSLTIIVQ